MKTYPNLPWECDHEVEGRETDEEDNVQCAGCSVYLNGPIADEAKEIFGVMKSVGA